MLDKSNADDVGPSCVLGPSGELIALQLEVVLLGYFTGPCRCVQTQVAGIIQRKKILEPLFYRKQLILLS